MTEIFNLAGEVFTARPLFSRVETQVLFLAAVKRLGYLKPSDEWTHGIEPLSAELQDAAHHLFENGWLPEFEEAVR